MRRPAAFSASFALAFVLSFGMASNAGARLTEAERICVQTARAELRECKASCSEAARDDRDECHVKDPSCVGACLAGREDCRVATGLGEEIAGCQALRDAAVAACREAHAPGTPERDSCVDGAQLTSFVCRDDAREANRAEVRACAAGFRGCHRACPRVPDPPDDPRSCRAAAAAEHVACKASCQEDWQVAKDACLGRDHACVDACRADRESCLADAGEVLGQRVATCNAERDAAVAACAGDDACIDAAQAAAFQCRDQAREDARPAFAACRDAFRSCVVGPPGCAAPPAP